MGLYSLCIKCKKKIPYRDKRCEKCQVEYNKYINSKKVKQKDKSEFYGSRKWKQLREQVLKDNSYMCIKCKENGIVTVATEVHHIDHLSDNWDKRYDYNNLIPLCYCCHHKIHD